MAIAKVREKRVMRALLAEARKGIKREYVHLASYAICAYLDGHLARIEDVEDSVMPATASARNFVLEPPSRLDRLRAFGFTNDEIHTLVVSRRTLARRKAANEPLSLAETDRTLRLERIAEHAERVFGSRDKARRWLRSEIIALDGARPIDLLQTESGARDVEQTLHRIDYGMLA
ncbi:MAG: antitoxin Xre/MbcA/ParS toxin-binding domain-containing protein [Rhizobiaceae bacterium]